MDLDTPIDRLKFHTLYAGMNNGTCVVNVQDVKDVLSELEKKDKIIDEMARFIDEVDTKSKHCSGYMCTVATTAYPEGERKSICTNCIKKIFAEKVEGE